MKHRRVHGAIVSLLPLLLFLVAPPLPADTVQLVPVKDNTLYEPIQQDGYADRSDGAGPTMFAGKVKDAKTISGSVAVRRAVIEFDIAGNIPAGATIDSVQLTLYCDKVATNTNFNMSLHWALSEWGEGTSNTGSSQQGRGEPPTPGDATWRHTFYPDQFWTTPGGDYSPTSSATRAVSTAGSFYTWGSTSGLVNDVQAWLDDPSQNHGWVLIGTETQIQTTKRFGTRENTTVLYRPSLTVNFATQTVTGGCCLGTACTIETPAACLGLGGAYQGDGTTCSPNPCFQATGACCAAAGTCTEVTQTTCQGGGGTYQGDGSACSAVDCPITLAKYVDPLPIPGVATPVAGTPGGAATYDLRMREVQQRLHRDLPLTTVWGYDDGFAGPGTPGPVIEARSGQPLTVNWINDLRELGTGALRLDHVLPVDTNCIHGAENTAKAVVHLHGGHVPAAVDGHPEATFLPGDPASSYTYPNNQQAGYLWFHDHALGVTRLNVYAGMAGLYLLRDDVEDAVNLPRGEFEIPLVIQDRKFHPDGSLQYPAAFQDHWFGDKVMVNGKVWPFLEVKRGKYRFRILNGSGSRTYTLSLVPPSGTLTFTVIGTEGGLLEAPARGVGELTIGPGERYDAVIDFAGFQSGDEILLRNGAGAPFPNGPVDLPDVMQFRVRNQFGDTDPVPDALRTIERLDPAEAVVTRDLRLKRTGDDGCGRQMWLINDLGFEDVTEYPELGTVEIWRFINDSGVAHPMHMHLVMFQVLDRDGFTTGPGGEVIPDGAPQPPAAEESGWKDTAIVAPGEILRVITRFENYKGLYPYHCHILEHEDHEMMRQFQTVQCGDAVLDPSEECDDGARLPGDGCSMGCGREEFLRFFGTAQGGYVQVTVYGVVVTVPTTAGQTAAQVAAAVAAAINADPALAGLGAYAYAAGRTGIVEGHIDDFLIADAGLGAPLTLRATESLLWWSTLPLATGYDVVRGNIFDLHAGNGNFATATQACMAENNAPTAFGYADSLAPGQGWWFLVRGVTAGGNGSYDSGMPSQVGSRDAEIAASGNDCF